MRSPARLLPSVAALAVLLAATAFPAPAQLLGPEFQVNTWTTGTQWHSDVAVDPSGGFFVTWMSDDQDGSSWGVYAQRYDAAGAPLGNEFRINTQTAAHQMLPKVAIDGSGKAIVVWESYSDGSWEGISAQRYDAAGLPLGAEFRVNAYTPERQGWPRVAASPSGNFVAVWSDQDTLFSDVLGVYGHRFDADGLPLGGDVTVAPRSADPSAFVRGVLLRDSGEFVVGWTSCAYLDPWYDDCDVSVRRFGPGGPLGAEIQVNTYTNSYQRGGALADDEGGGFIVAWDSDGQDGSDLGVVVRRYNAAGDPTSGEILVNEFTADRQDHPVAVSDGAGGVLVVWESFGQDGAGAGIFGRRFNPAGVPLGADFRVNSHTTGDQSYPAVAARGPGDFVVVWHSYGQDGSNRGIFGRLVTTGLLIDGFETGDTSRWSSTQP